MNCTDPVGMGLVTSESRPGTNVTGNLTRLEGLTGKQLELASELLPGLLKIGVLMDVSNETNSVQRREAESAAAALGLTIVPVTARTPNDIHPALQTLVFQGVRAVFVLQKGLPKKMGDFFSPRPHRPERLKFKRLFEFLNLIRNQVLAARSWGLGPRVLFFT